MARPPKKPLHRNDGTRALFACAMLAKLSSALLLSMLETCFEGQKHCPLCRVMGRGCIDLILVQAATMVRDFSSISPSARTIPLMKGHTQILFARETAELISRQSLRDARLIIG